MDSSNRLAQLDGLRALAAGMVVVHHYFGVPHLGSYGVQLFFVVSGFVVPLSIRSETTAAGFLRRRAFRLYPAYWLSVPFAGLAMMVAGRSDWFLIAVNATMLQSFVGVPQLVDPYWTLANELLFYAALAALLAVRGMERAPVVCLVWLSVATSYRVLSLAGLAPDYSYWIEVFLMPNFGQLFIVGFMTGRILQGYGDRWTYAALVGGVAYSAFGRTDWDLIHPSEYFATNLVALGLVLAAAKGKLRGLDSGPLAALGAMSYSVYLLHEPVRILLVEAFGSGASAFGILLTIGLAAISWAVVEQPMIRLGRYSSAAATA